jgi:hypothetical protein
MHDRLFRNFTVISTEVKRNGEICSRDPSTTLLSIDSNIMIVIPAYAGILKRRLVAIVVRLLRRLKKPSRNEDSSHPITGKRISCHSY